MAMGTSESDMAMTNTSTASDGDTMDMTMLNPLGYTPPTMFNPGYSMDDLAPVTCTESDAPQFVISANMSQG